MSSSTATTSVAFLLDGQAVVLDDYADVRQNASSDLASAWLTVRSKPVPGTCSPTSSFRAAKPSFETCSRAVDALQRFGAARRRCSTHPMRSGTRPHCRSSRAASASSSRSSWRGYGGNPGRPATPCVGNRADGRRSRSIHLPPDGYEFGSSSARDSQPRRRRWRRSRRARAAIANRFAPRSERRRSSRAAARPRGALAALAAAASPTHVVRVTLRQFAAELLERSIPRSRFPTVRR